MMFRIAMLVGVLGMVSCANVRVRDANKGDTEGVFFYEPAPYLSIRKATPKKKNTKTTTTTKTKKDGSSATETVEETDESPIAYEYKIVWLPNMDRRRSITWSASFGSVKPNFTLHKGWRLDTMASEVDSKVSETITGIAAAVPSFKLDGADGVQKVGLFPLHWVPGKPAVKAVVADENGKGAKAYEPLTRGRFEIGKPISEEEQDDSDGN